jgi:hypothetical protein
MRRELLASMFWLAGARLHRLLPADSRTGQVSPGGNMCVTRVLRAGQVFSATVQPRT